MLTSLLRLTLDMYGIKSTHHHRHSYLLGDDIAIKQQQIYSKKETDDLKTSN